MVDLSKLWENLRKSLSGSWPVKKIRERLFPDRTQDAERILKEGIGLPGRSPGFREVRGGLAELLEGGAEAESFYEWSNDLSSLLRRNVDDLVERRKVEWEEKKRESRKMTLASTFAESLKDGILALSDLNSIKILELLNREEEDPATIRELLDLKKGEVRWRVEWLEAIGMIREVGGGDGEKTVYGLSEKGREVFEERPESVERTWPFEEKRLELARTATEGGSAEKLLNVLDGCWMKKHRDVLEKLRKNYRDPLRRMSKSFWNRREGGTRHSKHAGVRIEDHEASGALLYLKVLDFHIHGISPRGKTLTPAEGEKSRGGKIHAQ